ncbi:MAG: hypothetical protein M1818_004329 [Claussenomyces sp. TS43310]|nr:MAG: hypothetical protein M1818_004329 [Claussenomyces sp. TS43310]
MSRRAAADVTVKLIVGAGQASPSPPVGPALGSKGVKSMDFCKVSPVPDLHDSDFKRVGTERIGIIVGFGHKLTRSQEFNARTAHMTPGIPVPARVTVRPDRSFHFEIRTPATSYLLLTTAGAPLRKNKLKGAVNPGKESIGQVSLKHIYEIAKIKQSELRLSGLSTEGVCKSVIAQAKSIGVKVVP